MVPVGEPSLSRWPITKIPTMWRLCAAPHGHWEVLSTVAAMTARGVLCLATFDGATDDGLFRTFVADAPAPVLIVPGPVVVLDNLTSHQSAAVRTLVS